jgi:hypothetical protein
MAGDLPWATSNRARFHRHLEAVRALARGRALLLHLQAPAEVAIERAGLERGEEWLSRSDQIAQSAGHRHSERIDRLVANAPALLPKRTTNSASQPKPTGRSTQLTRPAEP